MQFPEGRSIIRCLEPANHLSPNLHGEALTRAKGIAANRAASLLRALIAEEREDGILIRPAAVPPVEVYTPQRRAEFLLSSAVDTRDYAKAVKQVRKMGLDPARIRHRKLRGE
jgi:hypothetical protein